MRLLGILALALVSTGPLRPADLPAAREADPAVQQLQLAVAALYERQEDWEKAEAQYLAAAAGPAAKLREQALKGIERIGKLADSSRDSPALKLGDFYAHQEMWSEAEKYYLEAAKENSAATKQLALAGLRRVRTEIPRVRYAEPVAQWFDIVSALVTKGLAIAGVLVVVLAIRGVWKIRRRIEVLPFVTNGETAAAQITYWLSQTQAMIRSASALPSAANLAPMPYLPLPGLAEQLPDLGEIALAGIKLPVAELLRGLGRPRVRVSGGWIADAPTGRAFARFERRRGLSRYDSYATIKRDIPANRQQEELELLAYHILIKAAQAYVF